MINRNELVQIGQFRKPHGKQGEIVFSFTNDSFTSDEHTFLILDMDGIFVPFRIENCRLTSDTSAYLKLKNIDSDQKARQLTNKEVFFHKKYIREGIDSDSFTWDYFIGFILIDERLGKVGRIADVDTTTENTLFIIEKGKEEILIPAVEEFIIHIDENQEELTVSLPEGLIE